MLRDNVPLGSKDPFSPRATLIFKITWPFISVKRKTDLSNLPSLSHFWGSIVSYCIYGDPLSCNLFPFRLSPFQHFDLLRSSSSRNLGRLVWLSHSDSILSAPSWAHRPASSLPFLCDWLSFSRLTRTVPKPDKFPISLLSLPSSDTKTGRMPVAGADG